MIAEADLDARRHRRADDGPRRRWRSPRSSAGSPSSSRSRSRPRSTRRMRIVAASRARASRSRWATWSGSTRPSSSSAACSAPAGSRASTRSPVAPRRAVPGPDPRRRRDRRPRDPRRRHPVLDRRRAADPRVYAETAQRIHADHEDLLFGLLHFPSGATGMLDVNWLTPAKRRQLVVVGEEGMFELDYLTQRLTFTRATDIDQPAPDRRLRADVRGRGRRAAGRERRAARGRARRVPRRRPRRRPAGRRRRGRPVGRRHRQRAARRRRADAADRPVRARRRGCAPHDDRRPPIRPDRASLGGSIELPAQPVPPRAGPRIGLAVGRRARDGRDASPSSAPARWACRCAAQFASHGWRVIAVDVQQARRRRDQRGRVARRRGAGPRRARRATPTPPAGSGPRPTAPRRPATATSSSSSCRSCSTTSSSPTTATWTPRSTAIAPGRPRRLARHLRDDAAGRRHPRPVRAAPRGGVAA